MAVGSVSLFCGEHLCRAARSAYGHTWQGDQCGRVHPSIRSMPDATTAYMAAGVLLYDERVVAFGARGTRTTMDIITMADRRMPSRRRDGCHAPAPARATECGRRSEATAGGGGWGDGRRPRRRPHGHTTCARPNRTRTTCKFNAVVARGPETRPQS